MGFLTLVRTSMLPYSYNNHVIIVLIEANKHAFGKADPKSLPSRGSPAASCNTRHCRAQMLAKVGACCKSALKDENREETHQSHTHTESLIKLCTQASCVPKFLHYRPGGWVFQLLTHSWLSLVKPKARVDFGV